MCRILLTTSLATLLALGAAAGADAKPFGINIGGVQIGSGGSKPGVKVGGGGVKITLPGHVKHPVMPPVHPPVKPPVIKPKPPIFPKPPIVIHPPKPPVCHPKPPVVYPKPPVVITPPPVIVPPPVVCPPTSPWYFGMACERVDTRFGVGLRIVSVAPGGPAEASGLKMGDVLLLAGSVNLSQATSNDHGAQLVQSAITPEGLVRFTLVDAMNGMLANLTMAPTPMGAPAPNGAPIALNPAQPTSTM